MSHPHFHSCPECYEAVPCDDGCSIIHDLSEADRLFGHHDVCDRCQERNRRRAEHDEIQALALAARRA